jgi:hypothetical protein
VAVTNKEELRAWLEGQPQEVCVAVAYRAAMRVLPLALSVPDSRVLWKEMALAVLRASLTSGVAASKPQKDLKNSARLARITAYKFQHSAYAVVDRSDAFTSHVLRSVDAARAACGAAQHSVAEQYVHSAVAAAFSLAYAGRAAYADTLLNPKFLPALTIDVPSELKDKIAKHSEGKTDLLQAGGPWTFWAEWYRRAMAGDPLPWDLQVQIALIPNDIWEAGPDAVAAEIEKRKTEFLARSVAEEIVLSERGRLTLVPQPVREADHLGYLLETVDDALDLAVAGHNELTEESYQARLIRRTLSRYGNDPQRIEINFERAKVSLMEGIACDDLPASPANRDLIQSLSDAAGSIRESNPDIARNRERLNRIRLADMTEAQAQQIAKVGEAVAADSEDFLEEELLEGVRRLPGVRRDDPVPDAIIPLPTAERNIALEQRDSQVILFSRLSKIWLYVKSLDREELARVADTPEFKWTTGLASVIGFIATLVF